MDINEKINIKERNPSISKIELIKSGYSVKLDVTNEMKWSRQLNADFFDVISENPNLFIHKNKVGNFFTYRISGNSNPNSPISKLKGISHELRAGMKGAEGVKIIQIKL